MKATRLIPLSILAFAATGHGDTTPWILSSGPLFQDWTDISLISSNDVWSGVPSIIGYRGDDASGGTAVDPQTVLTGAISGATGVVDVNANQTNPTTFNTGGVTEYHIANPVVGLTGSGTGDFPHLLITLDATNVFDISVSYLLRDLEGSADNAVQAFALQYRVGGTGDFLNIASGFVADATTGPSLATLETPVSAVLPSDANGAALVEVRILTTNATGNDENVGVDDINITAVPEPGSALLLLGGAALLGARRRRV